MPALIRLIRPSNGVEHASRRVLRQTRQGPRVGPAVGHLTDDAGGDDRPLKQNVQLLGGWGARVGTSVLAETY